MGFWQRWWHNVGGPEPGISEPTASEGRSVERITESPSNHPLSTMTDFGAVDETITDIATPEEPSGAGSGKVRLAKSDLELARQMFSQHKYNAAISASDGRIL